MGYKFKSDQKPSMPYYQEVGPLYMDVCFVRAPNWKQPRHPETEEWIHKVGCSKAMRINKLILKNVRFRNKRRRKS